MFEVAVPPAGQQITNLAGYNRSTFYQYFSNIYELRDYVENYVLTFITEEFSRGADNVYDEKTVMKDWHLIFYHIACGRRASTKQHTSFIIFIYLSFHFHSLDQKPIAAFLSRQP